MVEPIRFMGGKATKRSRYGTKSKDRNSRTLEIAEFCLQANLRYHLIDSEWKWCYPSPFEALELASLSSNLKTVLTFTTRHTGSLKLLRQTLDIIKDQDRLGINLVVGNKAYLNLKENRKPAFRTLSNFVKFARCKNSDLEIFIGTEGLTKKVAELAAEYELIPLLLLDQGFEKNLAIIKDCIGKHPIAIYAPFLISHNDPKLLHDILYRLSNYILRRNWVRKEMESSGYDPTIPIIKAIIQDKKPFTQEIMNSTLGTILKRAADTLTIYGEPMSVIKKIKFFKRKGINIVIGLPIKDDKQQVLMFGDCVLKACNGFS